LFCQNYMDAKLVCQTVGVALSNREIKLCTEIGLMMSICFVLRKGAGGWSWGHRGQPRVSGEYCSRLLESFSRIQGRWTIFVLLFLQKIYVILVHIRFHFDCYLIPPFRFSHLFNFGQRFFRSHIFWCYECGKWH
jgi:hypothetical protein